MLASDILAKSAPVVFWRRLPSLCAPEVGVYGCEPICKILIHLGRGGERGGYSVSQNATARCIHHGLLMGIRLRACRRRWFLTMCRS